MDEDKAYLFVENKEHPAYGKTISVPMSEFTANAKEWKKNGIRPATGKELAPVQRGMEKQIAGESGGTAALVGGLRGATFGLSDVALSEIGPNGSGEALNELKNANPYISAGSELAGSLATLKPLGGLSSGIKGAAVSGALGGAGTELASQAREQKGYDVGDIAVSGGVGAGLGAGLAAAPFVANKTGQVAFQGIQKVADVGKRATSFGSTYLNGMNPATKAALSLLTGGKSSAVELGINAADNVAPSLSSLAQKGTDALKFREAVSKLTANVMKNNSNMTKKEAGVLAKLLLKKEVATQSVSISDDVATLITAPKLTNQAGPVRDSSGRFVEALTSDGQRMYGTEGMIKMAKKLQQARLQSADKIDEEIRMLLDSTK